MNKMSEVIALSHHGERITSAGTSSAKGRIKLMANKKLPRRNTPALVETAVLSDSARRCTLCFHLKGDFSEKLGQIAHLDDDRSNWAKDNLAWMCLDHHSLYDSTTSQHKNYTIHEVKAARAKLYDLVARKAHLTPAATRPYLTAQTHAPKVVASCDGAPRSVFRFTNDGEVRAFRVRVDPLPQRGDYFLSIPEIAQIGPHQTTALRPSVSPPPFNYGSLDNHFVWGFWKSLPTDVSFPFLIRYSDIHGGNYLTEFDIEWNAEGETTGLRFKRWVPEFTTT